MSVTTVTPIRHRADETYVCPCGSQWFSILYRMDTNGKIIERGTEATCGEGCGRKHHVDLKRTKP